MNKKHNSANTHVKIIIFFQSFSMSNNDYNDNDENYNLYYIIIFFFMISNSNGINFMIILMAFPKERFYIIHK